MERISRWAVLALMVGVPGCGDDVTLVGGGPEGSSSTADATMEPTGSTASQDPDPNPDPGDATGTTGLDESETGVRTTGLPVAVCGDGVLDEGEECDDGSENGNGQSCRSDCTLAFCGDADVGPGEECDDGPRNGPDAMCLTDCTLAFCGDGVVGPWEECDEGSANDEGGGCLPSCLNATCGDGYVRRQLEECDDGNDDDSDGCLSDCVLATCGDGFVDVGTEACDDANFDEDDGCLSNCSLPGCGNAFLEPGEECDDGNLDEEDGCASDCTFLCPPGDVIFVDENALGAANGASWDDAFVSIDAAIASAADGDSIWIAEGRYRPSSANASVVDLRTCVSLYGGFVGGETFISDRPNPLAPTTLSGDVQGDDDDEGFGDNAIHVIFGDGIHDVTLDGLIITDGSATGIGTDARGGGIYLVDSAVQVRQTLITSNTAVGSGGGVYAEASELLVSESQVSLNQAERGAGLAARDSDLRVEYGEVADNAATDDGGGLWFEDTTATAIVELDTSSFARNDAFVGGAAHLEGGHVEISASDFVDNTASGTGGVYAGQSESVQVDAVTFEGNTSNVQAGGLMLWYTAPATLNDTTFVANYANTGGGLAVYGTTLVALVDVDFTDNIAGTDGGGAFFQYSNPSLSGCEFEGNASVAGGAALDVSNADPGVGVTIVDSEFSSNEGDGAVRLYLADATVLDSTFLENVGGGIRSVVGALSIEGATFRENISPSAAAVSVGGGPSTIRNSSFESNAAYIGDGGAIRISGEETDIISSRFIANTAAGQGGAVRFAGGPGRILDSVFAENSAAFGGGAILARVTSPLIIESSSFRGNIAPSGAVLLQIDPSQAVLRNNAMWGNGGDVAWPDDVPSPVVGYTCGEFQPLPGGGNILLAADPFVSGPDDELFLLPTSGCVDAGSDAAATAAYTVVGLDWSELSTQADGSPDIGPVDMGAHYVAD